MDSKACYDCGVTKSLDEFNRDSRRPDDRQTICRVCRHRYLRQWEHGRSRRSERRSLDAVARRFWPKVDKNGPVHSRLGSHCWLWIGGKDSRNYGRFYYEGHCTAAPRVACILMGRDMPRDKFACHHCDNPPCVNPDHIFPGTCKENAQDMMRKGRSLKGQPLTFEPCKGSRHGMAKLTEAQALRIIAMRKSGMGCIAIARQFGLSHATVSLITTGKKWKHLPR